MDGAEGVQRREREPGRHRSAPVQPASGADPVSIPRVRLRPPAVPTLPRQRLLGALASTHQRLILVTGPAGSGKTTLLAQFAGHDADRVVVWYQLDAGDTRLPVLLRHLAQALGPVLPGAQSGWSSVDEAADALDEAQPGDILLALDDLHVLAGTPGEDALGRLLDRAPPWLRVAAACRQPPRWNLSRLRVSDALFEVGADDLRFRSWEVERLFSDLYGEPLPPGDLAQLTRGLEGWAAGLQLFHLATRGKPLNDRRRAVAALPARSKLIREYLTGNVLDDLPDELRAFLVDTSVFSQLSPALCDELRGRGDSRALLDELAARHAFVERDDEDGCYRYHEVFRTYLDGRLVERDGQAQARAWSKRAGELLKADGRMLQALRAYCRAEDWPSVTCVLETAGAELVDDAVPWLDWLPQGLIEDDPWAMLAAARRAAATGRFARALELYARAEEVPGAAAAAEICRRERAGLAGWVDPTAPSPRGWGGRLRAALRSHPAELVTMPPGIDTEGPHAGRALAAGLAAVLTGNLRQAGRWLAAVVDDPRADLAIVAAAQMALAMVQALGGAAIPGELGVTVEDLPEQVEKVDSPWLVWVTRAVRGLEGGGAGWQQAKEAADALDRHGDVWGGSLALFLAALGALLDGGSPVDEIEDVLGRLDALDAPVPACWCRAWLATALARRGATERALAAADAAIREAEQVAAPGAQVWAISVLADLAALGGDSDRARSLAARASALRRAHDVDVVVPPVAMATVDAPAGGLTAGGPAAAIDGGPGPSPPGLEADSINLTGAVRAGSDPSETPPSPRQAAAAGPRDLTVRGPPEDHARVTGSAPAAGETGPGVPAQTIVAGVGFGPAGPLASTGPADVGRRRDWAVANGQMIDEETVPLRVQCFGGLVLEVAGRTVDLRGAKPRVRAALRMLAAHAGRPVHVETLIESLWPDGDPVSGKRNVQVAVSSLRRLLDDHQPGAGALIARRDNGYLLALPAGAEVDVERFAAAGDECREAARRGDVAAVLDAGLRTLAVYGGELLPEEGPAEWVVPLRRNLAGDAASVALLVAEQALAAERYDLAVAACARGLDIDRYHDGLWRLLALAHERAGDPAAAAQTQERYQTLLDDLGVAAS